MKTDPLKFIARILVILVLAAPFGVLFFLVPWSVSSIWVLLLFKTLTPCLGSMLMIFLFSDYLFGKFNLTSKFGGHNSLNENTTVQYSEPLLMTDRSRNV
jgi:hypothetical protein